MLRPSYRQALKWLVLNDDTNWLYDEDGSLSVSTALVADMFGVSDERVTADLKKLTPKE